jgi:dipeptidyl aminopeptidase/acylaminoacyl peptidase
MIKAVTQKCFLYQVVLAATMCAAASPKPDHMRRPVTVADSIEMTKLGGPLFEYLDRPAAQFSADRKHFVVLTRKGNIKDNTNEYSVLLFRSAEAFRAPHPETVVKFTGSTNRPAIDQIHWLDNRTIAFLGATHDQLQQIYSYDITSHKLTKVTQHNTDIVCFDAGRDLDTIVFMARPQVKTFFNHEVLARGLVISHQLLADLMTGQPTDNDVLYPSEMFVQRRGIASKVDIQTDITQPWPGVYLSPDGAHAIVRSWTRNVPERWRQYKDVVKPGYVVSRYLLLNTRTRAVRPLVDAPLSLHSYDSQIGWSIDGKSVVIAGTYLPLDVDDKSELAVRASETFVVEVNVDTGRLTKIAQGQFNLLESDPVARTIVVRERPASGKGSGDLVAYQRTETAWQKVDLRTVGPDLEIREQQNMNTPPHLLAVDPKQQTEMLLMDLNPEFQNLAFGEVRNITWKRSDGAEEAGGLYLPPDYVPGRKYPLVIQTHGWDPNKFLMDGESTAGYAAQVLANKGFVVSQVDDLREGQGTTREGPVGMAAYEGLIDDLDKQGLIDRNRAGLMAWSRTGYSVRYTLAFSKYPIAAAAIVDGMDASYMQYLTEFNDPNGSTTPTYNGLHGAPPFGKGLDLWLKNATGFNLDKVHTPVRIVALGQYSVAYNNWEWFAGLKLLQKPIEMVWLRDALHMPVKPYERMTAQQGNVDWFCFWLKNEEDPDPAKAEQYARWRELRKQQETALAAQ